MLSFLPLMGHEPLSQGGMMKMLEYFFESPIRLRQLRCGPLAEHMDELALCRAHSRFPGGKSTAVAMVGHSSE